MEKIKKENKSIELNEIVRANPLNSSKFTSLPSIFTQDDVKAVSSNPYALIRSWIKRDAVKSLNDGRFVKLIGRGDEIISVREALESEENNAEDSAEITNIEEEEIFSLPRPKLKVIGKIDLDTLAPKSKKREELYSKEIEAGKEFVEEGQEEGEKVEEKVIEKAEEEVFSIEAPIIENNLKVVGKVDLDAISGATRPQKLSNEEIEQEFLETINNSLDYIYDKSKEIDKTIIYRYPKPVSAYPKKIGDKLVELTKENYFHTERLDLPVNGFYFQLEKPSIWVVRVIKNSQSQLCSLLSSRMMYYLGTEEKSERIQRGMMAFIRSLRIYFSELEEKENKKLLEAYKNLRKVLLPELIRKYEICYEHSLIKQQCPICGKSISTLTKEAADLALKKSRYFILDTCFEEKRDPEDIIVPIRSYYSKTCGCYHMTSLPLTDEYEEKKHNLIWYSKCVESVFLYDKYSGGEWDDYKRMIREDIQKKIAELDAKAQKELVASNSSENPTTTAIEEPKKVEEVVETQAVEIEAKKTEVIQELPEFEKIYSSISTEAILGNVERAKQMINSTKRVIIESQTTIDDSFYLMLGKLTFLEERINLLYSK